MILERHAKPTLTPFLLDHGETLRFVRGDGSAWEMTLLATRAEITARCRNGGDSQDPDVKHGTVGAYAFTAEVQINGRDFQLRRDVGTQASFYEPWLVDGVRLWFDAASCAFDTQGGFMGEKDWARGLICQPPKHARFAVQEEGLAICPEPLRPWYPGAEKGVRIGECYNGEDCWMGPYSGGAAHCGLDVNMPAGTVMTAPISFDDHYLFTSLAAGFSNNRWRGIRRWSDGSEWWLQCHHQVDMLVPVKTPLQAGTPYATGAGVAVGGHDHSHFMFRVIEQGGDYWLDPWILFWELHCQQGHAN